LVTETHGKTAKALVELASPEEFGAFIRAEVKKWAKLVKDAGIKPE
jgi:tripartite-type tricarboxylate transporter receptor subunit TctC